MDGGIAADVWMGRGRLVMCGLTKKTAPSYRPRMHAHVHVALGVLALVVGVLASLGSSRWIAMAMLLVVIAQLLGYIGQRSC